jgi:hypothetical protein
LKKLTQVKATNRRQRDYENVICAYSEISLKPVNQNEFSFARRIIGTQPGLNT